MAIDQLFWNPIFGVMFFSYLGLAEGKSVGEIQQKIKNDLMTAVMGSWTVWVSKDGCVLVNCCLSTVSFSPRMAMVVD